VPATVRNSMRSRNIIAACETDCGIGTQFAGAKLAATDTDESYCVDERQAPERFTPGASFAHACKLRV
jgi:hypothetical protein